MLSQRTAQTGKRVYRGTGQSPNRGQVSARGAQGYIKRELRNKNRAGVVRRVGGDGKSDNRSAVAAKALNRKSNTPTKLGGRPVVGKKKPAPKPKPKPLGGPIAPTPTPVTQVQVTKDGILQLPYDQDFGAEQLAAITDANQQLLGLKAEGDQQALEYGQGKRDTQLAYGQLQRGTLNQNAASGTAFSSRYGTAVATNAGGYANQMADLEQANTGFMQNQGLQRTAIQNSLNQQLAALAQQYADDLNDQAGGLGFGRNKVPLEKSNKKNIQEKNEKRKRAARAQLRRRRQRDNKKKGGKK